MKQTNYQLYDFLNFDPEQPCEESLWKACSPLNIVQDGTDVVVFIPFQKQKCGNDIQPELIVPRECYRLKMRAYGDKILRVAISFNGEAMQDSEMLDLHPELEINPLSFEKTKEEWTVRDSKGVKRAVFKFVEPEIDYWSKLIPPPEDTLMASFFPDGEKEIELSAYDQFFPARHDAHALACVEKDGRMNRATISFHAQPDEVFVGTGERFTKMDLSGQTFQLKNQDGQGVNNRRTYKNIPFYISNKMYGAFLHTSSFGKMSFADHSSRSVQLLAEQRVLDLFLFGGDSIEEILSGYRQVTGYPTMPPLWSFGTWMSRMTYFSADEVEEICDRLRKEDYPCDVIHLDTGWFRTDWLCEWKFNPERFPNPAGFVSKLKQNGYRVSLWQMPYVASEAEQLEEAQDNNYISKPREIKQAGGSNFSALDYAGTIDFTYGKAVDWYKDLLKELLEMGVVCIKTDFGEDIHMDADYHDMKPEKLNNLYALLYQKAAYEITKEITGDGIVWARAGWAGCQRYPLHWGGDAACSWDGMAGSLKGGLHLGLSGFAFWSHDVPGFHGVPDFMNSVIPGDLYVRWTQFGVFSSHIRYHGTSKREPYEYPEIADVVRKWWKLRYALIPYVLEQSKRATETGFPVLRALAFHHPEDKMCWHIDDQYYFGDDFLVAPVMNSVNKRDVYLPKGEWVNLFDGRIMQGEKWLKNFECPLDEMPVWVRRDAEVPVYPESVSCTDEMDLEKTIRLKIENSFKGIFKTILIEKYNFGVLAPLRERKMKTWKTNWEESKKRYIDWWNNKGLIISMWEHLEKEGASHETVAAPQPAKDLHQLWFDPQWRAKNLHYQLAKSAFTADIFPVANTHLGPGSLAACLGAELDGGEDTIWIKEIPVFNGEIKLDENNKWWQLHQDLLKECKALSKGKYYVGMPDLIEGLDTLASLKGTDNVLLDMLMQPEVLEEQLQKVNNSYFEVFDRLYEIIREGDEMAFCYFSIWAPGKATKLQSDISLMISEDDFRRFAQPYLREQAQKIDYTLYHLDGVDAMRHVEVLLEIEELNAVQWTPGVGEPQGGSPRWYELYKKILSKGKSIMPCWVELDELEPLLDNVGADGLNILMHFENEKDIDAALKIADKYR